MTAAVMNPDLQRQFMYLFERIGEPLYFGPRGEGNSLFFYNLPMDMYLRLKGEDDPFYSEFHKQCPETAHASMIIKQGFTNVRMNEITVSRPATMPDLSRIGQACNKSALYNYFNPNHRRAVRELRQILLKQPNLQGLLNMACACRDNEMINPKVWVSAFASCLLNRPDTKGFRMPAVWEVLPDMFFSSFCLKQATRQGGIPQQDRGVIVIDSSFTGRDHNQENRLAYFREDLGINSHHWHWHLIYTLEAPRGQRDRKGELFYYMHHEMIARYEAERLANGLPRTRALVIDEPVVKEGYFPKLTDNNSSQLWGSRQQDTRLTDINRLDDTNLPQGTRIVTLEILKKYRDRIMEAIDTGMVLASNGTRMPLNIDILGDLVEASSLSPNPQFYGEFGLHNMGHVFLAYAHDPEYKFRENAGVMGDTLIPEKVTAMRDPVFYRWHKYVDNIFDLHKQSLQPYSPTGGDFPLAWNDIQVESVQLQTTRQGVPVNVFSTYRMRSHVDLSRGMDFLRTQNNLGPVFVRIVHLNHDPYNFRITVRNNSNANRSGTVRIYMAPRLNENNEQFPMVQQRRMFFELDKFTVQFRPGNNEITRRSTESTVTIPWEQTFRDLERTMTTPTAEQSVCGCGWPQHMLIPRGSASGQLYDIVVFITNGEEDRVTQTTPAPDRRGNCRDAVSYCGILDQLYPDRKPMGYPFDRNPYTSPNPNDPSGPQVPVASLEQYVARVPNMRTIQVRVVYDSARVDIRNDGVQAGMREINGDPLMSTPRTICPDSGQPPRTDPRPPGSTGGTTASATSTSRPGTTTTSTSSPGSPSSMRSRQGKGPTVQTTVTSKSRTYSPNRYESSPSSTPWHQRGRQQPQQQSPSGSPTSGGWTHIGNPNRPSSPNWGWGWQG